MNVRIIDPRRPASARPAAWGREAVAEDFNDLDEPDGDGAGTGARMAGDDRVDLLHGIHLRLADFLAACLENGRAGRLPAAARACFAARQEELRLCLRGLQKTMGDLGIELPPPPTGPPETSLGCLAFPAEGPFGSGPEMIGAALFLNSLGATMAAAMLCEGDAPAWRPDLLPMLQDDCRFEGRLKGFLEEAGERAEALGRERIALAQSVKPGSPQRLWSFDLLRMEIRRLLGEGQAADGGGAFPAPGRECPAGGSW